MKSIVLRMTFVLLLLSFICILSAQVTVTGRVVGNDEPDGVVGAQINLVSQNHQYDTNSGEGGTFTINNVQGTPAGIDYELTVSYEGYIPHNDEINVQQENINLGVLRINEIAWPPRNVMAIEDPEEEEVNLIWNAAQPTSGTEQWLEYGTGQHAAGVGTGAAAEFQVAIRFSAQQLLDLDAAGLYLTRISFYPYVENATYTLKVWVGGRREPLHAGEEVLSQLVENVRAQEWNEVVLEEPVEIELHEELWFGYNVNTQEGHPAGCDGGPADRYYGDLMAFGAAWQSMADAHDIDRNWNLRGYAGMTRGDRSIALSSHKDSQNESTINPGTQQPHPELSVVTRDDLNNSRETRLPRRLNPSSQTRELEGYRIYRFHVDNQDDPDEWDELATIDHTDTTYTDTTWDQIGDGLHRFAVMAIYTDEIFSRRIMSNIVYPQYFAGGVGTRFAPWEIETAEHLDSIREFLDEAHSDKYFVQVADIDLGIAPWNTGEGWEPIGDNDHGRFWGTYDGDGYEIQNLTIDRTENYQGLFGYTENSTLKNIILNDVDIEGRLYTGGISGWIRFCSLSNIQVIGRVAGTTNVGGIAGRSWSGSVANTYSAGEVSATNTTSSVGGILGYQSGSGSVTRNSYSVADVTGNRSRIGGIIGSNWTGLVLNCFATGIISATGDPQSDIGGLVGHTSTGEAINSYWNVETTGQTLSAGGGEPKNTAEMLNVLTYQEWDFDDIWQMGHEGEDTYPYFVWQDEPLPESYPGILPPSGVYAGTPGDATTFITWSQPSMGEPDALKLYRNNQLIETFQPNITHFQDNNVNNLTRYRYHLTAEYDDEESISSNVAIVTPVPGGYDDGIGTPESPYEVATAEHLDFVRHNPAAHYIQTDDIDIEHIDNWNPIGSSTTDFFSGVYDGDEYFISNLTINRENNDYNGLFGFIGGGVGAVLRNIRVENAEVVGRRCLGAVVGRADDRSLVDNCFALHVDIRCQTTLSTAYAGGLAGDIRGNSILSNSFSVGSVSVNDGQNYVGGLTGWLTGEIHNSFTTCSVEGGGRYVGGLTGYMNGDIYNSYARGTVEGEQDVGGLVGYGFGNITNSYATGRITTPPGAEDVGGLIGRFHSGTVTESYWDVLNSGVDFSPAGAGRQTNQMTYPYQANTYVNWDFEDIWREDDTRRFNNGYPYLYYHPIIASPHPNIARNPQPQNQDDEVSIDLENLRWTYEDDEHFSNPVGFRVYFAESDDFDDDEFTWIPYVEDQENYSTGAVIPDTLEYRTTYFWKVVPTTDEPDNRSSSRTRRNGTIRSENNFRGDAENVPTWRFTVEVNPKPVVATNPRPEDEATDIEIGLDRLRWRFIRNEDHANPAGFRVYFNETGEFEEGDNFVWVPFSTQVVDYSTGEILPDELEREATYYWKVVPTTQRPNRYPAEERETRNRLKPERTASFSRHDADDVAVWSFSTEGRSSVPRPAENPVPEHPAQGISMGLETLQWDYISHVSYTDPVGFRVYANITGNFTPASPYAWVDYVDGQETYSTTEALMTPLDPNTTYYWRVVPTVEHPEERGDTLIEDAAGRSRRNVLYIRNEAKVRSDAANVETWRFTTGETNVEDETLIPETTEITGNYPNPFNPETIIDFALSEACNIGIAIYNSRGQRVKMISDDYFQAGRYTVKWNGLDINGNNLASGIYFAVMHTDKERFTHKMIMLK